MYVFLSAEFADVEVSCVMSGGWVTVISPDDISGLRRPKNIKFGTNVVSSTRMMRTLRFPQIVFYLRQNFKKCQK